MSCMTGWRRAVCWADNVTHRVLGPVDGRLVCRWHDRLLAATYDDDRIACAAARAQVSRLWAEDWDSDDDSIYDGLR